MNRPSRPAPAPQPAARPTPARALPPRLAQSGPPPERKHSAGLPTPILLGTALGTAGLVLGLVGVAALAKTERYLRNLHQKQQAGASHLQQDIDLVRSILTAYKPAPPPPAPGPLQPLTTPLMCPATPELPGAFAAFEAANRNNSAFQPQSSHEAFAAFNQLLATQNEPLVADPLLTDLRHFVQEPNSDFTKLFDHD